MPVFFIDKSELAFTIKYCFNNNLNKGIPCLGCRNPEIGVLKKNEKSLQHLVGGL